MRRRDVLGAVGAVASAAAGGCLGTAGVLSGGADGGDAESCPSFDPDADRTICAAAKQDGPVAIGRSGTELVAGEGGSGDPRANTLTFAVRNQSGRTFQFNPNAWEIRRRESGEWVHVAPDVIFQPLDSLPPAGQYEWELGQSSDSSSDGTDASAGTAERDAVPITAPLKPGEHAFSISGDLDGRRIECVARFSVRDE